MAKNLIAIKGKPRAIDNRVLVSDMHFGEQKTIGGIIISNDDGTTRGVYPRWAKVFSKGSENKDDYEIGDWILVEHGRWTRGYTFEFDDNQIELRMIEAESVLAVSKEKPQDAIIGNEYSDGQGVDIRPEDFGAGV